MPVKLREVWSFVKAVWFRAGQVRAPQLVAAITLRFLTSLLPLLLAVVSITGLIASGNANVGTRILDQFKLTDPTVRGAFQRALDTASNTAGRALVISILGSLFTGLGVVQAVASACDAVWQVPARGLIDKLLGVPWLIAGVVLFATSAAATQLVQVLNIAILAPMAALLGSSLAGTLLVLVTHRMLTNVQIRTRHHLPGATIAGIALAVFQLIGATIVTRLLAKADSVYGTLAGIFALITVLSLFGYIIVYGAVVNVVIWESKNGTTEMVGRAPRLPIDYLVELERGGQRPHPAAGSQLMRAAKFVLRIKS